jgi:hypothetical protein
MFMRLTSNDDWSCCYYLGDEIPENNLSWKDWRRNSGKCAQPVESPRPDGSIRRQQPYTQWAPRLPGHRRQVEVGVLKPGLEIKGIEKSQLAMFIRRRTLYSLDWLLGCAAFCPGRRRRVSYEISSFPVSFHCRRAFRGCFCCTHPVRNHEKLFILDCGEF